MGSSMWAGMPSRFGVEQLRYYFRNHSTVFFANEYVNSGNCVAHMISWPPTNAKPWLLDARHNRTVMKCSVGAIHILLHGNLDSALGLYPYINFGCRDRLALLHPRASRGTSLYGRGSALYDASDCPNFSICLAASGAGVARRVNDEDLRTPGNMQLTDERHRPFCSLVIVALR